MDQKIMRKSDQKIIMFEGPDTCGKTNIAKALSDRIKIPYFKNKAEWANFETTPDYFVKCLQYGDLGFFSQYLAQTGASVILDRSWPSEWVYSRVFARPTNRTALQDIDRVYSSLGARIIVPIRSDYTRKIDQFDAITPEKLVELHSAYMDFCDWTSCKTLILNVDDENLERELAIIMPFVV